MRALEAPSLLDRLLDAAPELSFDPPVTRQQALRDARAALRRDLEALLNTRSFPRTPPTQLKELRSSLLAYGTPDFIGVAMISRDQRLAFARKLEVMIHTFEPRLRDATVSVLDSRQATDRLLRLRIEATAVFQEGTVPMAFASAMDPTTLRFQVNEQRQDGPE